MWTHRWIPHPAWKESCHDLLQMARGMVYKGDALRVWSFRKWEDDNIESWWYHQIWRARTTWIQDLHLEFWAPNVGIWHGCWEENAWAGPGGQGDSRKLRRSKSVFVLGRVETRWNHRTVWSLLGSCSDQFQHALAKGSVDKPGSENPIIWNFVLLPH